MRVSAWIKRFIKNCYRSKQSEIEKQRKFYFKSEQKRSESSEKFQQDRTSLNLIQNTEGIYERRSRIQGSYPIYLPKEKLLTEKIIRAANKKTMYGEVTITMSNIRTYYWIPSLRKIAKSIIKKCHHCVRYRAMLFPNPKLRPLPKHRTQECRPFQVIGVEYAGPAYYRSKNKAISKSYILLFSYSVSRAIHLKLVPNLSTQKFIKSMKRLIARRRSPKIMRRHSRLELSGLPELMKTRSLTIF